jgi:hypothetical protein
MLEQIVEEFIEENDLSDFHDRCDVSIEIALGEYGFIRNPSNDEVYYLYTWYGGENGREYFIKKTTITLEEVREYLEESDEGFFDYIGQTKEDCLNELHNNYLSNFIQPGNQYDGSFWTGAA